MSKTCKKACKAPVPRFSRTQIKRQFDRVVDRTRHGLAIANRNTDREFGRRFDHVIRPLARKVAKLCARHGVIVKPDKLTSHAFHASHGAGYDLYFNIDKYPELAKISRQRKAAAAHHRKMVATVNADIAAIRDALAYSDDLPAIASLVEKFVGRYRRYGDLAIAQLDVTVGG